MDEDTSKMYKEIIGVGYDHDISFEAATKHPKDIIKCVKYIVEIENKDNTNQQPPIPQQEEEEESKTPTISKHKSQENEATENVVSHGGILYNFICWLYPLFVVAHFFKIFTIYT